MTSIRRQQIVLLVLGALGLYLVCAAVMYRSVRGTLYDEFDANLAARAASFVGLIAEDTDGGVELQFSDEVMPEFSDPTAPDYFQVWIHDEAFADGWRRLERSASMGSAHLPRRHGTAYRPLVWNLRLPDGRAGRAAGVKYALDADDLRGRPEEAAGAADAGAADRSQAAVVVVARGRESVRETLGAVFFGLLLAGAILGAAIVPLVAWSVNRSMRPVRALGRHVGGLGASELGRPLDAGTLPVELHPIVAGLNRLLRRLDEAFDRERRTTANIAHELRTPIAELRAVTDVSRRWRDDVDLARRAVRTAGGIASEMEGIVESLLRLARVESGQLAARDEAVPLRGLVEAEWSKHAAEADRRGIALDCTVPEAIVVRSDAEALELVVRNLLCNAVGHAPEGDLVEVRAEAPGAGCILRISNANPGLEAGEVSRVAEAFWRRDVARDDREHVGLGLAMVSAVGRAADLPVDFALEDGRFVVTVRLRRDAVNADRARPASAVNGAGETAACGPPRANASIRP